MRRPAAADLPEPDRVEGAPHPRETARLFGHAAAEAQLLGAHCAGRMHHAWLITGPRGIGKATLAWRIAAFLLATPDNTGLFAPPPPQTLDLPQDHPLRGRILALSEPDLFLLRRGPTEKGDTLSAQISVREVRDLRRRLRLTSADGGRRVAIVDCADEMNLSAANALLKLLEEPPQGAVFLLVSHQPMRLLPTIRSRCTRLALGPLGAADLAAALAQAGVETGDPQAMAELSQGSAGAAIRLAAEDGLKTYADLVALAGSLPRLDRARAMALSEGMQGRQGDARFELLTALVDRLLARLARTGATGLVPPEAAPGEARVLARLAPDPAAARAWADLAPVVTERARRGRSLNLDAGALCLDMLLAMGETAGRIAATQAA